MARKNLRNTWWVAIAILAVGATVVISKSALAQYGGGFSVNSSRPMMVDYGGGPGGQNFSDAKCRSGSIATGFHVQMGQYFNLVWVDCAALRPNGTLDRNVRSTSQAGSPGGSDVRDAYCPGGLGLIGLRGRAQASIDEAVGVCADPREVASRKGYPRPAFTQSITIPRPGGQPAQAQCQAGQVMVGIRAKSGRWIDHLWILCSDIRR